MSTHVRSRSRTGSRDGRYVPAYGPVDAALGYVLFYVVVDRATPTVVDVLGGVLTDVSPSTVRFGLALLLWFVLVVTVGEQVRRQLVALGVLSGTASDRPRWSWTRGVPSEPEALASLVLLIVGGLVAAWTVDVALDTVVSMIRIVATLDVEALVLEEFLAMVAFFVSFEVATWALDRLLVGGVREMLADGAADRV